MKNTKNQKSKEKVVRLVQEFVSVLVGCMIIALGFNLFLMPNQIASGGVVGISVIIKELFGVQPALSQWTLNISFFILGMSYYGWKFGIKTVIGSFTLPLFILLTDGLPSPTNNALLASVYGGLVIGIGLGLVFRYRGSTGGFSILARILNHRTGFSVGMCNMVIDCAVILVAGFVFTPEKALYALITVYTTGKVIDMIQVGINYAKVAFVISDKHEAISESILHNLKRGLSKMSSTGGYTGEERPTIMVVMEASEVADFKALVKEEDPNAFIIISDTTEVLGKGFEWSNHG